jgi:glutathione peroxidase
MGIITKLYGGMTSAPRSGIPSLYPCKIAGRGGEQVDLADYVGKVVLVTNTASKCGFTKQYDALEALYGRFSKLGLLVLAFPSNDFANQEPGSDAEIESFCRLNFGVTFPVFPKGEVRGPSKPELFRRLTEEGPADLRGEIRWNFEKFLIDKRGRLVGRWRSYVSPLSRSVVNAVTRELGAE